jgi:hypothetical protein
MGGKDSDESDDDSVENLKRTEGLDAQAFSAPLGAGVAPAPPKYIRVCINGDKINCRYGRTIKSGKILIICFSHRNFSVLPIFATQKQMRRQRMGILSLRRHQIFPDIRLERYGR